MSAERVTGGEPAECDVIALTGLRAFGYHGVFDHEKAEGQHFLVDLRVRGDVSRAAASDDLIDTVDYGALANTAVDVVTNECFDLIEALAGAIAARLLAHCADIEVTVHKPSAPIDHQFSDVSVTVRRTRAVSDPAAQTGAQTARGAASADPGEHSSAPAGGLAVLSLGANMGDAQDHIESAIAELDQHPRIKVTQRSSLYSSAPVGGVEQDDFFNAAIIVDTRLPAPELLAVCQGIELAHGRQRDRRWGPRTLDIDLVRYTPDGRDIDAAGAEAHSAGTVLTLPHPEAVRRAFVLAPWAEMRPHATVVFDGQTVPAAQVLAGLADQRLGRVPS